MKSDLVRWQRVNNDPFEYCIQQGRFGDEFVKLLDGSCLRRPFVHGTPATTGFAILCGPQGYLYSVELIMPDQLGAAAPDYLAANRASILFGLGVKCLRLAVHSITRPPK